MKEYILKRLDNKGIADDIRKVAQNWQSKSQKTRKTTTGLIAGALVVFLLGGGWLWYSKTQARPQPQDIVLVRTEVVGDKGSKRQFIYSGEVRGRYERQLAFQVGGKLIKRNVELGSQVGSGDVLMQIDPKDIQQTVNSSSAQVYSAESQLRLAENNLNRYRQLYEQGAVSRAQYDQFISAYDAAVAASRQASAQYSQGSNQLDYSVLRATAAGVVSAINVEAGQVVSAGQPVLTLVQDGEREVEISVPENRIEQIRTAKQIKISFWALPGITVDGKVREISPIADATTRTYKVRINLQDLPTQVKLGMTASVTLTGKNEENKQAVEIPLSAVYQTDGSPGVWVVKNNIVSLQSVKVGDFGNSSIQVLSGIEPGETIVTAGVHKLRNGQQVRIASGAVK